MKDFQYLEPTTLSEACSLLARYGEEAKVIAGGVALLTLMKQRLLEPRYLVSLDNIPGLDRIEYDEGGGLKIGPTATHRAVERSPLIREKYPVLAEMAGEVGSVQVRNLGTIGGNLCHAEPASDPPAVLMALNGRVKLVSPRGERVIPVEDFMVDFYTTALEGDEILAEIQLPPPPPNLKGVYLKFTPRSIMDLPVVGVATFITPGPNRAVKDISIAVGAASARAIRLHRSEERIKGEELSDTLIKEAAILAAQDVDPISDIRGSAEYRREMVRVFVQRALKRLA